MNMATRNSDNRQPDRHAFTLVEVLIATVIFSVILAAMNVTFYSAMHLEANTSAVVDSMIPLNHAVSIIKGDIKGVLMTGGIMAGAVTGLMPGSGDSQSGQLQIYTTTGRLDARQPWGDVQKVSYYLGDPTNSSSLSLSSSADSGKCLFRAVTRNLLAPANPDLQEQLVLNGVSLLEFSFYDGVDWLKAWDSTMQPLPMPKAIRVRIEFASEDTSKPVRLPLEMVVPLDVQGFTNSVSGSNNVTGTGGQG